MEAAERERVQGRDGVARHEDAGALHRDLALRGRGPLVLRERQERADLLLYLLIVVHGFALFSLGMVFAGIASTAGCASVADWSGNAGGVWDHWVAAPPLVVGGWMRVAARIASRARGDGAM